MCLCLCLCDGVVEEVSVTLHIKGRLERTWTVQQRTEAEDEGEGEVRLPHGAEAGDEGRGGRGDGEVDEEEPGVGVCVCTLWGRGGGLMCAVDVFGLFGFGLGLERGVSVCVTTTCVRAYVRTR